SSSTSRHGVQSEIGMVPVLPGPADTIFPAQSGGPPTSRTRLSIVVMSSPSAVVSTRFCSPPGTPRGEFHISRRDYSACRVFGRCAGGRTPVPATLRPPIGQAREMLLLLG